MGELRIVRKIKNFLRRKFFKPFIMKKNLEGIDFDFLIGDQLGLLWYANDRSSHPEIKFLKEKMVSSKDVIFDCGAHHGQKTVIFSQLVGDQGKVIAFEADKHNAEVAQKNLEINNVKNATIEHKAVGSGHGWIDVSDTSSSKDGANVAVSLDHARPTTKVEQVALDEYIHEKPTLLKIDVEGFELEVLKGATEILKTRPKLAIEIHTEFLYRYGTWYKEILSYIDMNAYDVWIQDDDANEPKIYQADQIITKRVQLYTLPKIVAGSQ